MDLCRRSFLQLSGASLAACGLSVSFILPAQAHSAQSERVNSGLLSTASQTGTNDESDLIKYIATGALPFWVAGLFLNAASKNLDFDSLPADLREYFRKAGGASRTTAGAQSVWETIPFSVRMEGPKGLREFLSSRDWSHFIPRSMGGSDRANAGIFEDMGLNRARGATPMTVEEIEAAREALRTPMLQRPIWQTARVTVPAATVGVVAVGVLSILEYGLWYQEGKIDQVELFNLVWKELSVGIGVGISIVGIIAGLVILFPQFMAVVAPIMLPFAFFHFAFVGYRFYEATEKWKRAGFDPLLGAWNTARVISAEAWARAAGLFDDFIAASKETLQSIGEFSEDALHGIGGFSDFAWQGIGSAPGNAIQGTRGITVRTWQGVEFFPYGTPESIGDFSAGALQGAGSATQNAVQVTTETTSGAWEWATVTSDGIAVDVSEVPEHVLDWLRETLLPWLGDRVSPAVFWK